MTDGGPWNRYRAKLPLGVICNIASQMARGVEHGHLSARMVHGRLSPKEVYVEPNGLVRVGGFGGDPRATSPRWA